MQLGQLRSSRLIEVAPPDRLLSTRELAELSGCRVPPVQATIVTHELPPAAIDVESVELMTKIRDLEAVAR